MSNIFTGGLDENVRLIDDVAYRLETTPAVGFEAVASVFGRGGVVVAMAGDYTAAQITNAVSTLSLYADPAWLISLNWTKITNVPANVANAVSSLGSYANPTWITTLDWAKIVNIPSSVTFSSVNVTGALTVNGNPVSVPATMPSTNPGAGSKKLWYDPADGNRVKFAP